MHNSNGPKGMHLRRMIDVPDTYRPLELYTHVVPIFGQPLFMSDLILKAHRQTLKESISKDTGSRRHSSTVHSPNKKDCFCRIYEVIQLISVNDNQLCAHVGQNLKWLMFGKVRLDHPEDTLESNGMLKRNSYHLVKKLLEVYIEKEICFRYSHSCSPVQKK